MSATLIRTDIAGRIPNIVISVVLYRAVGALMRFEATAENYDDGGVKDAGIAMMAIWSPIANKGGIHKRDGPRIHTVI